jgi:hypothetical protein
MPPDAYGHFIRVLAPGYEVTTGRKNQRTWRVGGIALDDEFRILTGKLGWQPRGEEIVSDWSEEAKDWVTMTAEPREHKLIPFGYDGERRLLAVLRERSTAPKTIAAVFEKILDENEFELEERTTYWSVEPVLDTREFLDWLQSLEYVRLVSFTAKLPNPEPMEEFGELWDRLQNTHATQITETIKSDREEGLVRVPDDPDMRQAIAMGRQGFASLRGRGRRDGTVTTFNQEEEVARERVPELPDSWSEMRDVIRHFLVERARRFLDQDAA